jgi:hypothetical protein
MTGLPSRELTGAFCRVPLTWFSQAPWYALPVHLCRFRVRSDGGLFPGTAGRPGQSDKTRQASRSVTSSWPGNINPVPIDYAFRPRLRGRLTLLRLALSRNPWTSGEGVSHPLCRYSCQHSRFRSLHRMAYAPASQKTLHVRNASPHSKHDGPYHGTLRYHVDHSTSRASAHGLSPVTSSPQDSLSRPVSCYAIFKGWLLLSQPPGCFGRPTCFPT